MRSGHPVSSEQKRKFQTFLPTFTVKGSCFQQTEDETSCQKVDNLRDFEMNFYYIKGVLYIFKSIFDSFINCLTQ